MMIKVGEALRSFNGEAMQMQDTPESPVYEMTLGKVVVEALLVNERELTATDKVRRYDLALRVYNAKNEVEVTPEELTEIRACVGKAYPPVVVGAAYKLLG